MESRPAPKHKNKTSSLAVNTLSNRLIFYAKQGHLFYWTSFFVLILIELFIGGQLSKHLTGKNYSTYINVLNTLPFYNILVNAGMSYAVGYFIAYSTDIKQSVLAQAYRINALGYVLFVAAHIVLYCFIPNTYLPAMLIAALISISYSYRQNLTAYFLASGANKKAAGANMLQRTGVAIAILSLSLLPSFQILINRSFIKVYPIIELSALSLYAVFFWRTNQSIFTAPNLNYRRRLLAFGKYATINNTLNVLYYTIVALIIHSSAIDLHVQIILGMCFVFFRYTAATIAPLFATMSPQLTRLKQYPQQVAELYRKYFIAIATLSILIAFICRLLFGYMVHFFYARQYDDLPVYFNFFCYLTPLLFINSLNGTVLAALGKIKFTTRTEAICTAMLLMFYIYSIISPITHYSILNYMILAHLILKCALLGVGTWRAINR